MGLPPVVFETTLYTVPAPGRTDQLTRFVAKCKKIHYNILMPPEQGIKPESPQIQEPVFLIEVDKITSNPHQPRKNFDKEALKDLANSIREFGILQPLIVTKTEKETEAGTVVAYILIAGERRWLAAKLLGLERVPAIIRNVNLDRERLELAIVENLQRENLDPIETARAYSKLQDEFRLTQREIAGRVGKSREVVANALRLLNLPSQIQEAVSKGSLSESQARLLITVAEPAMQQALFEDILKNSLSVRELRSRIRKTTEPTTTPTPEPTTPKDPELMLLERQLEETLGTKVKLERSGAHGKIMIDFYSPEELHNLVTLLERTRQTPAPSVEQEPPAVSPDETFPV